MCYWNVAIYKWKIQMEKLQGRIQDFKLGGGGISSTQGRIQGGRTQRAPTLKLEKKMIFWRKIVIFHTNNPKKCSRLPSQLEKNVICWRKIVIFHTKYPLSISSRARYRYVAVSVTSFISSSMVYIQTTKSPSLELFSERSFPI
jgi:hypothetical protein